MVKCTETIRRQQPTNCLSAFDCFWGSRLKGKKCYVFQQRNICHLQSMKNPTSSPFYFKPPHFAKFPELLHSSPFSIPERKREIFPYKIDQVNEILQTTVISQASNQRTKINCMSRFPILCS